MTQPKRKRLCSSNKERQSPNTQPFLNLLSTAEAEAWRQAILDTNAYSELINHRHLPTTLSVHQLE